MPLHTWADHVVHVELLSRDGEISRTTVLFLQRRFHTQGVDVSGEAGRLELRSDDGSAVTAGAVAQVLAEAGVRAHRVHERREWSVAEVTAP